MRDKLIKYIQEQYGVEPEHLWKKFPNYIVFRHQGNRKWFGLVMDVSRSKLGLDGDGLVDILNVKLDDPIMVDDLIHQPGYMKGYHISRGNWISILLDGTVSPDEICSLLEVSYLVTAQKKKQ